FSKSASCHRRVLERGSPRSPRPQIRRKTACALLTAPPMVGRVIRKTLVATNRCSNCYDCAELYLIIRSNVRRCRVEEPERGANPRPAPKFAPQSQKVRASGLEPCCRS